MEKCGRKQRIAIIEHCNVTAVGLRHLLMSARGKHFTFHFFRGIAEYNLAGRQGPFDGVMYCLSGTRELRIECLLAMGEIANHHPEVMRIILANDKDEAALIRHLSPTYIHGVLSKSGTLSDLRHSVFALLEEAIEVREAMEDSAAQRENRFLSPTENLILRYMTYGYSLMDISQQLGRNIKTIRAHKFNAMTKLGVNSDIELLSAADLLVSLHDINDASTSPVC